MRHTIEIFLFEFEHFWRSDSLPADLSTFDITQRMIIGLKSVAYIFGKALRIAFFHKAGNSLVCKQIFIMNVSVGTI
jgi:hypothetical protein